MQYGVLSRNHVQIEAPAAGWLLPSFGYGHVRRGNVVPGLAGLGAAAAPDRFQASAAKDYALISGPIFQILGDAAWQPYAEIAKRFGELGAHAGPDAQHVMGFALDSVSRGDVANAVAEAQDYANSLKDRLSAAEVQKTWAQWLTTEGVGSTVAEAVMTTGGVFSGATGFNREAIDEARKTAAGRDDVLVGKALKVGESLGSYGKYAALAAGLYVAWRVKKAVLG